MALPTGEEWAKFGQRVLDLLDKLWPQFVSFLAGVGWAKAQETKRRTAAMEARIESENIASGMSAKSKLNWLRKRP